MARQPWCPLSRQRTASRIPRAHLPAALLQCRSGTAGCRPRCTPVCGAPPHGSSGRARCFLSPFELHRAKRWRRVCSLHNCAVGVWSSRAAHTRAHTCTHAHTNAQTCTHAPVCCPCAAGSRTSPAPPHAPGLASPGWRSPCHVACVARVCACVCLWCWRHAWHEADACSASQGTADQQIAQTHAIPSNPHSGAPPGGHPAVRPVDQRQLQQCGGALQVVKLAARHL
jgi:hypothetical protein